MLDFSNPATTEIDGSILWVIEEYTHDEWFHTLTKLNNYCFLIHERTDYLDYLEPVARKTGPYCSNLLDYIRYYESQGWVVYDKFKYKDKEVFKLTEEGKDKLKELMSEEQAGKLRSCLEEWDEMPILQLTDEVYSEYPEYRL